MSFLRSLEGSCFTSGGAAFQMRRDPCGELPDHIAATSDRVDVGEKGRLKAGRLPPQILLAFNLTACGVTVCDSAGLNCCREKSRCVTIEQCSLTIRR
jgi:hypothetical protein